MAVSSRVSREKNKPRECYKMTGDLYVCSESNGLGAFLKSYVGIFVLGLLTKRQVNFNCPRNHEGKEISKIMHTFFHVKYEEGVCDHDIVIKSHPVHNACNETFVFGDRIPIEDSVCVFNSEHQNFDKIISRGRDAKRNKDLLFKQTNTLDWIGLHHLALSSLRIRRKQREIIDKHVRDITSGKMYDAVHIRTGDASMHYGSIKWPYQHRKKWVSNHKLNLSLLGCVINSTTDTNKIFVTDSMLVKKELRSHNMNVSDTFPIHAGMNLNNTMRNLYSIFIDWFLLRNARATYTVRGSGSTFSETAAMASNRSVHQIPC